MKVRLGELTRIRTGKLDANASSENGEYPFFTCSKEPLRISSYSYDCECILVAGNGDLNVKYYNGKFDAYQRTYIIEDNGSDRLYLPYLFYFMDGYVEELRKLSIGGVIKYIKLGNLTDALIELPNIEKQKEIVGILRKAKSIVDARQRELSTLDNLIKARFVEMFGDPMTNPKEYPIKTISELFDVGSSKRVFESEWREKGVPFYRAREIVKLAKEGFVNNELYIDVELYEKYKTKYGVPKPGDIMVTGVGTLGVCYIVQPHDKFYFKDGNTLWFKNRGVCSERFIVEQYKTDFVRNQIEANANVSTVGTYTITNANNTKVLVPSLEEQLAFNSFVAQVDKSKFAVQKALDEAQLLFDSLMQKYFG
ncbi:MAG: restriction endonuclease subunit S [Clostridia bacterium]|nr:restriction endonuclease subunit S [Clostridia bacterium]